MKTPEQLDRWLLSTVRAWILCDNADVRVELHAEAVTLIWVLDSGGDWNDARVAFDEMVGDLRTEMGIDKEGPADDPG